MFGDTFRYVEAFLLQIRLKPEIFSFIATSLKQYRENIDSCIESFSYSFFLDLVHPENTEEDLLNRIKNLIESELSAVKSSGSGHVSAILHESLVLRNMLRHYLKRRNQRKYMKLIFKKGLREIMNNQDLIKNLKLDPKLIYTEMFKKQEPVRNSVPQPPKERRSIFRRESKKFEPLEKDLKESTPETITTEDAMHNEEVYKILVDRSNQIASHCRTLLQGIYDNVDTMPFGLRWICKQMIFLIQRIFPDVGELEKITLLGNFLFTLWWIPAIFDPIKNGLLQNVIIQNSTLSYFKIIGNIFKNIFKSNYFEEIQYFKINEFIADESSKMRKFLNDIVSFDESIYDRSKVKAFECEINEVPYEGNLKTMMFYYQNKLKQPVISNSDRITKSKNHLEDEKNMKNFKIITFVVTLNDIRLLAKLVKEKEEYVSDKGWNDFLRYAKTIRNSDELGSLVNPQFFLENKLNEHDELHCFFMKKDFGEYSDDIENSYTTILKKSKISPGENQSLKMLIKLQEAVRNLLISLDMSLFFDPNKEWSLADIIEFVIHFSYLFENNKSGGESIPLKLLAQFISTYLKEIPTDYTLNSYRKLYKTLLSEYEDRYETCKDLAARNKKLLLLSINFLDKHIIDLRQEVRVFEMVKQKSLAVEFIKNRKIPACLVTIPDASRPLTQLWPQSSCPHSKLASVSEFVLGSKKNIKSLGNPDNSHLASIEEFIDRFVKLPQLENSLYLQEDNFNISGAYFEYLNIIQDLIKKELHDEQSIEMVMEEIEKHLTSSMFSFIFPIFASNEDKRLYMKTVQHAWVKPEHLDIVPNNRNEAMWKFAIETFQSLEIYRAPADKLDCFVNCMSIIVNVLSLMSTSGSGVGTDDSLPLIIYIIIKAQPKRLHSNLNYISKFRQQTKMIGMKGFVFQQFQSAASFIEELDERSLTIDKNEYYRLIKVNTVE